MDNPARKQANAVVRDAEKTLAAAERDLATLIADPGDHPRGQERPADPRRAAEDHRRTQETRRCRRGPRHDPRETARQCHQPQRGNRAAARPSRRSLQMILRLLAHNAEHWLSGHLNAYLRDDDEYRAITREGIIRGLAGTIAFTPAQITVRLEPPRSPRTARALALLIDEINQTPPVMPGDHAPHHLPARRKPQHLTRNAQTLPEI